MKLNALIENLKEQMQNPEEEFATAVVIGLKDTGTGYIPEVYSQFTGAQLIDLLEYLGREAKTMFRDDTNLRRPH